MGNEAGREGERCARVRDEVQLDLVAPDEVAVHRDDAQDFVAHGAACGHAHRFVFRESGALRGGGLNEPVRIAHEEQPLGGGAEHGATDFLRDGELGDLRVERQELLAHLLFALVVDLVRVLGFDGDFGGLGHLLGLLEEHVVEGRLLARLRR